MEEGAGAARGGAPSSWSDFWELAAWPFSSPSFAPAATGFLPSAQQTVVARGRDNRAPNQHRRLTCLKLGKRQCYGEQQSVEASRKRERPPPPRCQVDGCSKVLVAEKQYHKRHKVCETHSKAHKVVLLGLDQRFCQQCSRFHEVSEFDDFKRSCRRRLAGHNKRRRKNSSADSIARSPALLESAMNEGMAPSFLAAPPGCAPSLLSSKASAPWIATVPDFSSRSSAALNELIAENRAALLARQLFIDQGGRAMIQASPQPPAEQQLRPFSWPHQQAQQVISPPAAKHLTGGSHVTLDLMQMPGSFEIVSATASKEGINSCSMSLS